MFLGTDLMQVHRKCGVLHDYTIDPDMYQVYHSTNIVGKGGTDSNHYHIADTDLDT